MLRHHVFRSRFELKAFSLLFQEVTNMMIRTSQFWWLNPKLLVWRIGRGNTNEKNLLLMLEVQMWNWKQVSLSTASISMGESISSFFKEGELLSLMMSRLEMDNSVLDKVVLAQIRSHLHCGGETVKWRAGNLSWHFYLYAFCVQGLPSCIGPALFLEWCDL